MRYKNFVKIKVRVHTHTHTHTHTHILYYSKVKNLITHSDDKDQKIKTPTSSLLFYKTFNMSKHEKMAATT